MLISTNKFASALLWITLTRAVISFAEVPRSPISTQQVVDAIATTGTVVHPYQIELLSQVSLGSKGTLRVVSVTNTDTEAGTVKAKLRCQTNTECLPFYVLVHGVDKVKKTITVAAGESMLPNVIRGGDRATLILESSNSRMSLPVICLQNGVLGQRVRATSLDRKRVFDAEVVSAGMLKGNL